MKGSDAFKETIKSYLDKRAAEDELFAVTYQKQNKTLDECCNYVIQCAQKGGSAGYADNEVFGWAVHYYDEDDIKKIKPSNAKVIVNQSIELTDDEKATAREMAIKQAAAELKDDVKKDLASNVQLTEEEVAEAKQFAIKNTIEEARQKLLSKKKAPVKNTEQSEVQSSLF